MRLSVAFILALILLSGATPGRTLSAAPSSFSELAPAEASTPAVEDERGIVALDQSLREITNPFTVLCIAARPGDEDDGTLAYVRKKLGARTVILFATRGEGEESAVRGELDLALGALHTSEAIEAVRMLGADVLFLNLRDVGYSKSPDDPLSIWGHDEALRRMVRAIRSLRPDVIITNHDPKSGEGAEQAVARLALEAFTAAAATEPAPEAGSEPWRARRFFQRADNRAGDAKIDLNEYDRVRGKTYAQIGLAAHNRFVSRGFAFDRLTPDRESSYYKLIASSTTGEIILSVGSSTGLLDGLTLSENLNRSIAQPRVGALGVVDAIATGDRLIDALIEKLIEKRAEGTADALHERYGAEFVRVFRFTAAIERAIVLALGISLEVTISDREVVGGQVFSARLLLRNGGVRAFPVVFSTPERFPALERNPAYKDSDVVGVGSGGVASRDVDYEVPKDAALTLPHSAHLYDEDYYSIGSSLPGAQPDQPFGNRLIVFGEVGLGQVNIRLAAVARFDVASPVEVSTIPFALVKDWSIQRDIEFTVRIYNRTPGRLAGALWVVPLAVADDDYDPVHITFARQDEAVTIKLKLRLPILKPPLAPDVLLEVRREKPAAPDPLGSAKISVRAAGFDVVEGLRVGYIRGPDDWILNALTQLGVDLAELKIADISVTEHGNAIGAGQSRIGCADLARFDTIVIDRDAYFTHPELLLHTRCLLRYVRQGGNLVVLGQIPDDWNLALSNNPFAPYPIKLSKDRIVYEPASVKILDGEHPLMSKPNGITAKDFDGWVVERAQNIPREWSSDYTPLLETRDPGEEPNRGGLLVARYGDGSYIYTSFQWRRQLVNGNSGAFRVFANLMSLSKVSKSTPRPR